MPELGLRRDLDSTRGISFQSLLSLLCRRHTPAHAADSVSLARAFSRERPMPLLCQVVRSAMNTYSRPGRSGASRTSRTR